MSRSRQPFVPEISSDLGREFAEGRVVLFIGAGVSMAADAPGWEELVERLLVKSKLEIHRLRRLSLEQKISLYLRKGGRRQELRRVFREELEQSRDLTIHKALVSLPVSVILTTNYDPNLEKAAQSLRRSCEVIFRDCEVPQKYKTQDLTIVHLYGNTEEPLASEEDLVNFERDHPALSSILQHILLTRTVFFLGFSFRDYNILNHILRTQAMMCVANPVDWVAQHYAYMIDTDPSLLSDLWAHRRLQIFASEKGKNPRETSRTFLAFVQKLAQGVAELSYDQKEREQLVCRVETGYYFECIERQEEPLMRRESTFSVLALPERFQDSGLELRDGWALGIRRKRIYEKWLLTGSLRLILNCQPRYWEDVRGYKPVTALQRLKAVRGVVRKHLDNPRLVLGIRRHPTAQQSFVSLGRSLLLHSDSPPAEGIPHKRSDIVRDRHAIGIFIQCFDREMEDLMRDAGAKFGTAPSQENVRQLKMYSIEILDGLITALEK